MIQFKDEAVEAVKMLLLSESISSAPTNYDVLALKCVETISRYFAPSDPADTSSLRRVSVDELRKGDVVLSPICARRMADVPGYEEGEIVSVHPPFVVVHVGGENLSFNVTELRRSAPSVADPDRPKT